MDSTQESKRDAETPASLLTFGRAKSAALSQPSYSSTLVPTNTNPRTRLRPSTRPMEVLCLGRERTGTLSLRAALLYLGYYDVYHMASPLWENPPDCEIWIEAINRKVNGGEPFGTAEWDQLLGECMAVTDQPCAAFAEELMDAYPEAKIVLTVRDSPEVWHRSVSTTILALIALVSPQHVRHPGWNPLNHLQKFFHPQMPGGVYKQRFFDSFVDALEGDQLADEKVGVEMYLSHNEQVRHLARQRGREVLEFNVKQGWGPLCEFLGKDVAPEDVPFPRINESKEYQESLAKLRWAMPLGYAVNVVKVLGVPALAVGTWSFLYHGELDGFVKELSK